MWHSEVLKTKKNRQSVIDIVWYRSNIIILNHANKKIWFQYNDIINKINDFFYEYILIIGKEDRSRRRIPKKNNRSIIPLFLLFIVFFKNVSSSNRTEKKSVFLNRFWWKFIRTFLRRIFCFVKWSMATCISHWRSWKVT